MGGLLILTSLVLIGIGFSSWQIVSDTTTSSNSSINSDFGNITNLSEYITITGINTFTYSKDGIVKNEEFSKVGEVSLYFNVKIKNGIIDMRGTPNPRH